MLVSPVPAAGAGRLSPRARRAGVHTALLAFWAPLLAVPLAGNLGAAWLLVEATTAASALLVGFSGKARALEAGWKYLVLTTLGLGVALLGIVVLRPAAPGGGRRGSPGSALHQRRRASIATSLASPSCCCSPGSPRRSAGRRSTTGCPTRTPRRRRPSRPCCPRRSCRRSCSWRGGCRTRWRRPSARPPPGRCLVLGLASLAVAVPFLWRPLPWKRLLAYSSLEHMGVIAVGIGFAHPLALAGVVSTSRGTRVAKTLGFVGAVPLLDVQPAPATHAATGVARTRAGPAATLACPCGARRPAAVAALRVGAADRRGRLRRRAPGAAAAPLALLALGFLGLAHALDRAPGGPQLALARAGAARAPRRGGARRRRPCRPSSRWPSRRSRCRGRRSSRRSAGG